MALTTQAPKLFWSVWLESTSLKLLLPMTRQNRLFFRRLTKLRQDIKTTSSFSIVVDVIYLAAMFFRNYTDGRISNLAACLLVLRILHLLAYFRAMCNIQLQSEKASVQSAQKAQKTENGFKILLAFRPLQALIEFVLLECIGSTSALLILWNTAHCLGLYMQLRRVIGPLRELLDADIVYGA